MKEKKTVFEEGTQRIKTVDLKKYIKKNKSWKIKSEINKEIKEIIDLYINSNKKHILEDDKINVFLKGHICPKGKISGSRVSHLPSGEALARGGFSLFAKSLSFNPKPSSSSWDVSYQNTSGTKTYLYSSSKVELEKKKKAEIVDSFSKNYFKIKKKLKEDIEHKCTIAHLGLFVLLRTHIRVGNLEYFKQLGHKGLTTLQRKDISTSGNKITFDFIGKDGVPQVIPKVFPDFFMNEFKKHIKYLKKEDFIFAKNNIPLHSSDFSKILFEYTGEHFYPHIIRSFYADSTCEKFLKEKKSFTKKEVEQTFTKIAQGLGHKKFNKKRNKWETSYKVTIDSYIRPIYSLQMIEKRKD